MNFIELIQLQVEQVYGNKVKADIWLNQPKQNSVAPLKLTLQ